jgi:putative transposase
MELVRSGHSVYELEYHLCFVTKFRRKILNPGTQGYLLKLFPKFERKCPGVSIIKVGMERDHVHIIILIPPRYSIASTVGSLKQFTSTHIRKKLPWIKKVYDKDVIWSRGYYISSVGINSKQIRKYVEYQGKEDSGQNKLKLL